MGGWATFPQFPQSGLKFWLGWHIPESYGPQPWHLKHWRELGSLLLTLPSCPSLDPWVFCPWCLLEVVPVPWLTDALQTGGSLSVTSLAIMRAGVARSAPVCPSPPMDSLSGAIWGAEGAVALPCSGQGSHQFGNLVPQFHSTLYRVRGHSRPSPYLITGFFILTLCPAGSNHQLGISGPGVAIEVPYEISNVLEDPVEEMILECCWTYRSVTLLR